MVRVLCSDVICFASSFNQVGLHQAGIRARVAHDNDDQHSASTSDDDHDDKDEYLSDSSTDLSAASEHCGPLVTAEEYCAIAGRRVEREGHSFELPFIQQLTYMIVARQYRRGLPEPVCRTCTRVLLKLRH